MTAFLRHRLQDPRIRQLLLYCLPALVLGVALRIALSAHQPFGIFHDDTPDFLSTPDQLLSRGSLGFHEKKTFLYPLFLTVHCLLPVPLLASVAFSQHVLGLAMVILVGLLCRLWFPTWRWVIVPLTLLTAINPHLLWYEHTLMAESLYAFCTVLLACAGTLYALNPSIQRFGFLSAALLLESGARPEGKLLFGSALLLLVLIHWRQWPLLRTRIALMLALALVSHLMTRTEQGGLLLYTSVARMTPVAPRCAPGIEPYIADLRTQLQARWEIEHRFPGANSRREVTSALKRYLAETGQKHRSVEKLCAQLASETCRSNWKTLPQWFTDKLRHTANEAPSGRMDEVWLIQKQGEALASDLPRIERLAPYVLGESLTEPGQIERFVSAHYTPVPWVDALMDGWNAVGNALRLPQERFFNGTETLIVPGVPIYFLLAALGLFLAALRPSPLRSFHIAWGLGLAGLFAVIILTANVKPRFRFVFEPFYPIYIALVLESLWLLAPRRGASQRHGPVALGD